LGPGFGPIILDLMMPVMDAIFLEHKSRSDHAATPGGDRGFQGANQMKDVTSTWVVVADARAARIFSFTDKNGEWTLSETIKGDGSGDPDQTAHSSSKASEHKGALHGHGEQNPKETQERRFAHTLGHVLERGHASNAFAKLALVAPPKLLGELRENLSRGLQTASVAEIHKDYTHCGVEELMRLLRSELPV
jgi:protein required for attachment to host cells